MIAKAMGVAKGFAGALALTLLAGSAVAGGLKDGPAPEGRTLSFAGSFAVTNDYVFRGFSQSAERPAVQGTLDVTYGILYGSVFLSNVDFGENTLYALPKDYAQAELTFSAGIKPVLGPITFDLGVIYYTYPKSNDLGGDLNFFELKAGGSFAPWKDGTLGLTGYYSPDYTGELGDVWTAEMSFAQVLPRLHSITPTFSALVGYSTGDSAAFANLWGDGDDYYVYWNAGVSFGFTDNFSIDLRYWDTSNSGGFCDALGRVLNCDARFAATAKVTF